jgi:single-strand DNA-binding protein
MSTFNRIIVVGNLGRDPELRYSPQGLPICSFSLATNERQKDSKTGEVIENTIWYRANIFGRKAETAAQYLQKGAPVYVDGKLKPEEWTDHDGNKRFTLNINASDFNFIGSSNGRDDASQAASAAPRATAKPAANQEADDDFDF